jgi:prolipoprotein diacylglyceryl transferase
VPIRAYALCIIVGIVVALLIGDRRWSARGGERGVIYDIALWAVPFGLIGGRLYHLMTDWRTYFGDSGVGLEATLRIWDGGLGIWGAVALGAGGAWIGCRRRGIPLPAFGDAVAPGIVLAQAIGRLGNYFNQELYGRETTLPWGLEIFWRQDSAGVRDPHLLDGVSTGELYAIVQPTFLYELLWNLLVFAVLIYADRRFRVGHGRLFALYVAGYCVGRFGIELLRDDVATQISGIRVNSFTSMFVLIGAVVYIVLAPKGREDPATLGGAPAEGAAVEKPPAREPEKELATVGAAPGTAAAGGSGAVGADDAPESASSRAEPETVHEPADADEPGAEEPAVEEPPVDESAVEESEGEEAASEDALTDEVEAEEPAVEESGVEEAASEESTSEEPVAEEPDVEEPEDHEPEVEEPAGHEAEVEGPAVEEPEVEDVTSEAPGVEESEVEEPEDHEPEVEEPEGHEPEVEEVASEEPEVEESEVEDVTSEAPVTEQPDVEEPEDHEAEVEEPEEATTEGTREPAAEKAVADAAPADDSGKKRRWWRRRRR